MQDIDKMMQSKNGALGVGGLAVKRNEIPDAMENLCEAIDRLESVSELIRPVVNLNNVEDPKAYPVSPMCGLASSITNLTSRINQVNAFLAKVEL